MLRTARSLGRPIATAVVLALGLIGTTGGPSGAAIADPTYVRTIGGPGHAGVYAWGMATATDGTILVSDYNNYVIRRYSTAGVLLQTFSGRGDAVGETDQPYGLAVDPNSGRIYMADLTPREIEVYDADGTPLKTINIAAYGGYYSPRLVVDSQSHVWVVNSHTPDGFRHRMIVLDADGNHLFNVEFGASTTAPTGVGLIRGLAVGPDDRIYLADTRQQKIKVLDSTGAIVDQWGVPGVGPGKIGKDLRGVAIDAAHGWLYLVENADHTVEKFTLDGTPLATFTTSGLETGQAWGPREITVGQDGNVYVADYTDTRVVEFSPNGTVLQTFPNDPAPDGLFNQPEDVAVNRGTGDVYVADTWNHRIQRFGAGGVFKNAWGYRGNGTGDAMSYPRGIAIDQANGHVWLNNTRSGDIKSYTAAGSYVSSFGSEGDGPNQFYYARGIWVGTDGRLYIPDSGNLRLKVTTQSGSVIWSRPCGAPATTVYVLFGCTGVTQDAAGTVYAAAPTAQAVYRYSRSGTLLGKFGKGTLGQPMDVAFWNGRIYVSDQLKDRISVFSTDGTYLGSFGQEGTGHLQFDKPTGLSVDAQGRLYVADTLNDRVEVVQLP